MSEAPQFGEDFAKSLEGTPFRAVFPAGNELQIDIDSAEQYEKFIRNLSVLQGHYTIHMTTHVSRSGGDHRHVTLTVPGYIDKWQRIAFQAALGSDPTRELLSCIQALEGDPQPTAFREPK